jgi:hypothetical protein
MKFDGTNWVYIGNHGFSEGEADYTSLAFSPSGQPYVAYTDYVSYNRGAAVKKFDGTNWVYVGVMDFSNASATYTCLAFSPENGQPYVAYRDNGQTYKATVMYFDAPSGVHELNSSQLSIYPNPATNKITFEFSGATKENVVSIVNLEGQELITSKISGTTTTVDVSTLTNGFYFVRLTGDNTVCVGKFIKQ